MMYQPISISEKTMRENKKANSHNEIGKKRWKKLKELENSGMLSRAETRLDIVSLLGYEATSSGRPYSWVSNQVKKGRLREEPVGHGKFAYYTTGKEPDYYFTGLSKAQRARRENIVKETVKQTDVKSEAVETVYDARANDGETVEGKVSFVIKYGDISIEVNNADVAVLANIVEKLSTKHDA